MNRFGCLLVCGLYNVVNELLVSWMRQTSIKNLDVKWDKLLESSSVGDP